jgi:multiple sugar transport system substrate-binding protein
MAGQPAIIDPTRPIPVYAQLKSHLIDVILKGTFGAKGRLPTESELCRDSGLSRTPVNRALSELASEGVVIRHRRNGTFVNPTWLRQHAHKRTVSIVAPSGHWSRLLQAEAPDDLTLSVDVVELASLHNYLTEAVANGTAPDLAVIDSVWVAEFAAAGYLRALDDVDAAWTRDEYRPKFAPTFVESQKIGDASAAVQLEADVAGLWYDRKILLETNLQPPATWEELRAACDALRDRGWHTPLVLPGGPAAGETATYFLLALLASNGAGVLGPRGVELNRPEVAEALQFLQTLVATGAVPTDAVTWPRDRPIQMLAAGTAVFAFGGSYELPALAESAGLEHSAAWRRFGFLPTPAGPSGAPNALAGGMALGIFRQGKNPELAMRLVQAVLSPEAQSRMALSTGQVPTRTGILPEVAASDSLLATSSSMLDGAVVRPTVPSYDRVSQQLQTMLAEVIRGQVQPVAAGEHTAALIAAITGLPMDVA